MASKMLAKSEQIELRIGDAPARVDGRVLWWRGENRYGMIWSPAIEGDILLHAPSLKGRFRDPTKQDIIECEVERRLRGLFATRVIRVRRARPDEH